MPSRAARSSPSPPATRLATGNPHQLYPRLLRRVRSPASWPSVPSRRHAEPRRYSSTGSYVEIAAPGGAGSSGSSAEQHLADRPESERPAARAVADRTRLQPLPNLGFSGTSMAAPHVTALAALLYSQGITKPAAIEAAIKRFAVRSRAVRQRRRVWRRPHRCPRDPAWSGSGAMSRRGLVSSPPL